MLSFTRRSIAGLSTMTLDRPATGQWSVPRSAVEVAGLSARGAEVSVDPLHFFRFGILTKIDLLD